MLLLFFVPYFYFILKLELVEHNRLCYMTKAFNLP